MRLIRGNTGSMFPVAVRGACGRAVLQLEPSAGRCLQRVLARRLAVQLTGRPLGELTCQPRRELHHELPG